MAPGDAASAAGNEDRSDSPRTDADPDDGGDDSQVHSDESGTKGATQFPRAGTILEALDIDFVEVTADRVELTMPVGPKVYQPMGLLHGGASAVMAETAASIGAYLNCDPATEYTVGIELNISHLRARSEGTVNAVATPIRKGRAVHVWIIDLRDQDGVPVATARCTLAIRKLQG